MKRKNAIWLSLIFAVCFACAPIYAHAAQQNGTSPPQSPPPAPPHLSPDHRDAQRAISGPYRLTYTMTKMDGPKRMGSQRYTIVLDANAPHSSFRFDSLVPVHRGSATSPMYDTEHISVGVNATLLNVSNGMELITDISQTAFANDADHGQSPDAAPPVTRSFGLTTTALLTENKPVMIGQLDVPGSTHSLQVTVELTKLP